MIYNYNDRENIIILYRMKTYVSIYYINYYYYQYNDAKFYIPTNRYETTGIPHEQQYKSSHHSIICTSLIYTYNAMHE